MAEVLGVTIRWTGGLISAAGWAAILWWAATAGSHPTAVAGSFDVPAIGFLVVMVGFFVWLAGMIRGERAERTSWGEIGRRQAPAGYMDTFVFRALGATSPPTSERIAARPSAPAAGGAGSAEVPRHDPQPVTPAAGIRPFAGQDPQPVTPAARRPAPSPVALAVLDSIELRRLETGEAPLPIEVRRVVEASPDESAAMPRPATAAARARA